MNTNLLVHNILFMSGGILNILLVLVMLYVRRRKIDNLVVTFSLMTLSVAVFQITQVLGSNAATGEVSRQIFMWNLCVIPIQIFMTHWFFALLEDVRGHRKALFAVYASGIVLFVISIVYPESYLLTSVPKMYFPFYYVAGNLQWLTRVWFHVVGAYYFIVMLRAYKHQVDPIKKNRYLFVMLAVLYGFIVGESAVFLVYDIHFDPMWSSFFGLYTFLIAYSIIRYQLLNVRIIFQKAFAYTAITSVLMGIIILANASTNYIKEYIYDFPIWIMPSVSALVAMILGYFLWKKLKESDQLKYEFVTVIAHKFRTPLTSAKWATEELIENETDPEKVKNLRYIMEANEKLVALTGTLIDMSNEQSEVDVSFRFKAASIPGLIRMLVSQVGNSFVKKKITLAVNLPANDVVSHIDADRMVFVLQTLLENALSYTKEGGHVSVGLVSSENKIHISVSDDGIGISKHDQTNIFSKFFRTDMARTSDTEGFGVGLYLTKEIVRRHGGNISVYSEGENRGSTFTVSLPINR